MQSQVLATLIENGPYETNPIFNNPNLDIKELCSRKLFELLMIKENSALSQQQQKCVESELVSRQHYLRELGKLRGLC